MNIKEKLTEATILALQGKLQEDNNWSYKPTSNSNYARSKAKRAKMGSSEYIDNIYKSNVNYNEYEQALQILNNSITSAGMFIDDVQIMTGYYSLLGIVAICKDELTKNFRYSSSFESGVFIHVDRDTKEVSYRFAVKKPEEINVVSEGEPSKELINAVKTYLFLSGIGGVIIDNLEDTLNKELPYISTYTSYDYEPYYYPSIVGYGRSNAYKCTVSIIPNKKNYTYTFMFNNKQYKTIDDVIKAVENDYNNYLNNYLNNQSNKE